MVAGEGQVHLVGSGRDLLMGEGTQYDMQDDFNPFIRQTRADQGGPRPYADGNWLGAEWTAEVVVPLRVIANGTAGDVPTTRQAIQAMVAAFKAVGATGEIAELRFHLEGDDQEFVMFGRPRGPEPDLSTIGLGYVYASAAFVAADPRIYSGDLTTVTTGMGVQRGGLMIPARPATTQLTLTGASGSYASTPNHASLQITGDLDLRVDADLPSWASGAEQTLIARNESVVSNQRSYRMRLTSTGTLRLTWSPDGTALLSADSSVAVPIVSGRLAVRAALDVDNGAGQRVVTFYTAPSIAGPWTQLGTNTPVAGVTSIHAGTAALEVGSVDSGTAVRLTGNVLAAQVYSGIAGTLVANPDFTARTAWATSFADSTGKTWTVNGAAKLRPRTFRGGVTLPMSIPGRLAGGVLIIDNHGDTPAPLLLRVDGPIPEPTILLRRPDGVIQSVRFDLDLAAGEWITVDTVSRQALLNDQPSANQRGRATWDMDEYPLLPGRTVIRFGGSEFNTEAALTASARSAYS